MSSKKERQIALVNELNNTQNKWAEDTRSVLEIFREAVYYESIPEEIDEMGMTWEKAWMDYKLEQWCKRQGRSYRPLRGIRWSIEEELHPRYRVPLPIKEKEDD